MDLSVVDQRLEAEDEQVLETTDERLGRIFGMAAGDRFVEAAEAAQELWSAGYHDVRVLGALLYGVFAEQGAEALPELFGALLRTLRDNWDFLSPKERRGHHMDVALKWLLSTMVRQIKLHEMRQDEVWSTMNGGGAALALQQTMRLLPDVEERVVNLIDRPRCLPYLQQIEGIFSKLEQSAESLEPRRQLDDSISVRAEMLEVPEPPPANPEGEGDGESSDSGDGDSYGGDDSSSGDGSSSEESGDSSGGGSGDGDSSSSDDSSGDGPGGDSNGAEGDSDRPEGDSDRPEDDSDRPEDDSDRPEDDSDRPEGHSDRPEGHSDRSEGHSDRPEGPAIGAAESVVEPAREQVGALAGVSVGAQLPLPLSLPLGQLLQKLHAFDVLIRRKDLRRAAIVAADLMQLLESFDPRVYLPSLFVGLYDGLARHGDELEPLLAPGEGLAARSLRQLYLLDVGAFVGPEEP